MRAQAHLTQIAQVVIHEYATKNSFKMGLARIRKDLN